MGDVAISRIALDVAGKLRVYPDLSSGGYLYIYRAASSVRWDDADKSLFVLPVDGFTTSDELKQIVKAVECEYGDTLIVDDWTLFDVSSDAANKLRACVKYQPPL